MAAETQPRQATPWLFRTLCYNTFSDVRIHHSLYDLAVRNLPGVVAFECTVAGYVSFYIDYGRFHYMVRIVQAEHGVLGHHVHISFTRDDAKNTFLASVRGDHCTTVEMLQDIFTQVREHAAAEVSDAG